MTKHQKAKEKLLEFIQLIKDGVFDDELKQESETLYNDWRLPTIQELLTLVNYEKRSPACDLKDIDSYYYWSSTTLAYDLSSAWAVSFHYGFDYYEYKSRSYHIRCVRDGISGLEWSTTSDTQMTWYEARDYAKNLIAPVYYKETK